MPAEKAHYAAESDVRYVDFLLSEESATITNVTQTDILTDAGVPLRSVFFKRYFFLHFLPGQGNGAAVSQDLDGQLRTRVSVPKKKMESAADQQKEKRVFHIVRLTFCEVL